MGQTSGHSKQPLEDFIFLLAKTMDARLRPPLFKEAIDRYKNREHFYIRVSETTL